MVHGNYSDRGFWVSSKGVGLAPFLSSRGYEAWVLELRGHGRSPKGSAFSSITAEEHIKEDLPAAARYVVQTTGKPVFLTGHSAGGIFIAGALSSGCLETDQVLGTALFGAQITYGERFLKIPPLAWSLSLLIRLMGKVPSKRLGLGPEPEPAGEMLEFIRWKRLGGHWEDAAGTSYWSGLGRVTVPLIAVAGAKDKNDPPEGCRLLFDAFGSRDKEFVILARDRGFQTDYDHIGMVVSKEAAQEVWPLLADWMDRRRGVTAKG
jgi:predicted alpha/beta hydrolase